MTDTLQDTSAEVKTFGHPPIPVEDVVDEAGNTYCQVHTDRETALRCNSCTRLMCAKCAVPTPVGYRCEQCVRERERGFFNANATYYLRLVGVCGVLGGLGAFLADLIGFWLFVFFLATFAGGIISEAAMRATKGQRGRYAAEAAAGAVVAGSVIAMLLSAAPYLSAVSGASLSPEQVQQIIDQYGPEQAEQIIEGFRQQQSGVTGRILRQSLIDIGVWIYIGVAAAAVYGRLNIYGRGNRRR